MLHLDTPLTVSREGRQWRGVGLVLKEGLVLNKALLEGLTSLRESWPAIVCVSPATDTERRREMGKRARWHGRAYCIGDLGQASSPL